MWSFVLHPTLACYRRGSWTQASLHDYILLWCRLLHFEGLHRCFNKKENNSSSCPTTSYKNLVRYLINSRAYDGQEIQAFRALYGNNYVQICWLMDVYHVKMNSIKTVTTFVSPFWTPDRYWWEMQTTYHGLLLRRMNIF